MPDEAPHIYFGGPDLPPRLLRDELQSRIEAVPSGGEIAWLTYYFRDRALARALMAASDRGVRVVLRVEGAPRYPNVNEAVIAMLEAHGLKGGLKVHRPPARPSEKRYPYWHSKIYCFSHPAPAVLVGSFNPSGDEPEDEGIIAAIGDQDRGHNLLVAFTDRKAYRALRRRVRYIGLWNPRFDPIQNLPVQFGASTIWTYPRWSPGVIDKRLQSLGEGDCVQGAVSHLKRGPLAEELAAAARRGAYINLLLHDTERRVPEEVVADMIESGVVARRYVHRDELPLHLKFLIVESGGLQQAWFGSFNFNRRSYRHNHEILVGSRDPLIVDALKERFAVIAEEVSRQTFHRR